WVRGLSIDLGGHVARAVGALTTLVEGLAIVLIAYLYAKARQTRESFTAAYVASAAAFVALGKVLSPQFLIWLIPLVPLRVSGLIGVLLLASVLFTQLEVNYGDHGLRRVDWSVWLLAARNALLLAVLVLTVRRLARLRTAVSD